jgi:hypothetical protein
VAFLADEPRPGDRCDRQRPGQQDQGRVFD